MSRFAMSRFSYLGRCLRAFLNPERFICVNCRSSKGTVVSRKFVITSLQRCENCGLQFRVPTDDPASNLDYYENKYSSGFTTGMPSNEGLAALIANDFEGEKNWSYYIGILKHLGLGKGTRIFDFGCSWGYGSYQMSKAGYSVIAFEIAPTRRKYAEEKLRISAIANMEEAIQDPKLVGTFDCFFCSHVLEHVPSPSRVFEYADALLKGGGIFVSFTPNGSEAAKIASPDWNKWWGEVHPNFIDDYFLDKAFNKVPRVIGSSPVGAINFPNQPVANRLNDLTGPELFFAARTRLEK
jgi:SAM-dependent methyltransferase